MQGVVKPTFSEEHKDAMVTEGEEVLTLRPEERGTQKMFVNTDKISEGKCGPLLMDDDWVVLCRTLRHSFGEEEWIEMHEKLKDVCKKIGVKKAGQKVAGMGKSAWRKTQQ